LIGKGRRVRTVPIPQWVKQALDRWMTTAGIREGKIFRAVTKRGKVWGKGISQNLVWYVVRNCCKAAGLDHIAPHDMRRTCAKLCHSGGGELEQIQFLLGHASVQTTERYLGCKQNLGHPVNDRFTLGTRMAFPAPAGLSEIVRIPEALVHKICEIEAVRKIESPEGGHEHGDLTPIRPGFLLNDARAEMVIDREGQCSPVLRSRRQELDAAIQSTKETAAKIRQASELWELEHHLTQLRKEIDRKFEYKYSTLVLVFANLVREGKLDREDLRGLSEEKLRYIRQHAGQSAA
jgi:site-specific recombinase XerC